MAAENTSRDRMAGLGWEPESDDWQIVEATIKDLGRWISDQQAMPDDNWVKIHDSGLAALARLHQITGPSSS